MITKTLVCALPAVLLLSAGSRVTAQEKPSPPDRVKPVPAIPATPVAPAAVPAVPVPIKSPKRTGVATIDDADFVTTVPEPGVVPSTTKRSTNSRLIITKERDDIPPLVIQFSDKSDGHDSLAEDLTILTVRVRKAMERSAEEDGITRSTARIGRGTGGSSVRSMYVDGFGPVVFVKVNFPLLAPKEGEQKDPGPAADSEWNKAKQELLAEKHVATVEPVASQPYDAAQVETLKEQILAALKDASNMRQIKLTEWIAVTIFGPPAAAAGRINTGDARGTVMTIRVKKSDIDAFAANKIDSDKFKAKATITAYVGNGYGMLSVNSWAKGGTGGTIQLR